MDDDPFHLLGVTQRFDLDLAEIRSRVLRMTAKLHPDRASDPLEAQSLAQELAAVNEAASILEDEEQRADLLLRLLGGPSASEDRSLPEGFLEQMLETRMQLEEVIGRNDQDGRDELEAWANEQRAAHVSRVAGLFGSGTPSITQEDMVEIRSVLNTWRYIERMIEQLHPSPQSGTDGLN